MKFTLIGFDLAKNVFHYVGVDSRAKVLKKKCLKRAQVLAHFATLEPTTVVMEACSSAHYWARELQTLGHKTMILPAQHVKPYRVGQKNDYNDAHAIAKAGLHGDIRPVVVKSEEQQSLQSIQTARALVVQQRTALVNQIRGQLQELGHAVPQGVTSLRAAVARWIEPADEALNPISKELLEMQYGMLKALDQQLSWFDQRVRQFAREDERCKALQEIPGFGPVASMALLGWMGQPERFGKGRHAAAALGLVPSQNSSGGKSRLGKISKCGDPGVRCYVVHGARAALRAAMLKDKQDPLSRWAVALANRRGVNKATVALANKIVRIAWAILSTGEAYRTPKTDPQLA